jgi:hypothetical protein
VNDTQSRRRARYSVTFTPAPTPATPFRSIEREAFDCAYSGPEVGPVGGSWPDDGRHVPCMVWRLPVRSAFNGPRRDNF